jgi:hypothetical protein
MVCQRCVEALEVWRKRNEELNRLTTILTAHATAGDQVNFERHSVLVEEARLRAENARAAVDLHRAAHDLVAD